MSGAVILLLVLQGAFVIISWVLWKKHILKVNPVILFAMNLVPLFGEICLFVLYLIDKKGQSGKRAKDLEVMRRDSVLESGYRLREEENGSSVVPLEDALILGDSGEKRSAMMRVLMDSAGEDLSAIREAKKSGDTEVVHYAASAMTEMSKKYDLMLQRAGTRYQSDPDSDAALNQYIEVLEEYLAGGMADGELLEIQRVQYRKLLRIRIGRTGSREDMADLAESLLDSKEYEEADTAITALEKDNLYWVRTLSLRIRYLYETGHGERIQELVLSVEKEPYLPGEVEEFIRFWKEPERSEKEQEKGPEKEPRKEPEKEPRKEPGEEP